MHDDIEGVGELAVAQRGARLEGILQEQKQVFGLVNRIGLALELDPAFPRGGLDAQLQVEGLQIPVVVVVELLRDPRAFKVQSLGRHRKREA